MKTIALTREKFALVDDDDFEWLNGWKWMALKGKHTYYAVRADYSKGRRNAILVYMHCLILGIVKTGIRGDHIDRNGLNNQRNNLRKATSSQNNCNRPAIPLSSSKYKGVSWHKATGKWMAAICINEEQKHLGLYNSEIEAAIVYNKEAIKLHGEFALLNEIKNEDLEYYEKPENKTQIKKTSKYKYVYWDNREERWVAYTYVNNKKKYIGYFVNEIDAALAYNNFVRAMNLSAKLNVI